MRQQFAAGTLLHSCVEVLQVSVVQPMPSSQSAWTSQQFGSRVHWPSEPQGPGVQNSASASQSLVPSQAVCASCAVPIFSGASPELHDADRPIASAMSKAARKKRWNIKPPLSFFLPNTVHG
jgi:hypothetical protein